MLSHIMMQLDVRSHNGTHDTWNVYFIPILHEICRYPFHAKVKKVTISSMKMSHCLLAWIATSCVVS